MQWFEGQKHSLNVEFVPEQVAVKVEANCNARLYGPLLFLCVPGFNMENASGDPYLPS